MDGSASSDFAFSTESWHPDKNFISRVRIAYRIGVSHYEQPADTMWNVIDEAHRREIHDALLSKEDDDSTLRDLLGSPSKTALNYGLDTLSSVSVGPLKTNPKVRAQVEDTILKHIGGMLDTIGARNLAYPENGTMSEAIESDQVLALLDKRLGFSPSFPNPFEDEFGFRTKRGLIAFKVPMAISQAYLLGRLAKIVGGSKVLEIGPGVGRTAFYARQAGFTDYTTVDTPFGIVAQACWLAGTLGANSIWLPGDEPELSPGRIRLFLPHMLGQEDFDIVLNADSFTEMPIEQAKDYFVFCAQHCRALLSINHEANSFQVRELPGTVGVTLEPIRSISTIRLGYVDEIFFFNAHRLFEERERLRAQIADMQGSTSWKITAPLRAMRQRLSRLYDQVM